jgi:hypothetical protein
MALWDEQAGTEKPVWRVVPPELCAKNRGLRRARRPAVQKITPSSAPGVPDSVVFARLRDEIVVANLDSGSCVAMDGVAASFWSAAAGCRSTEAAEQSLLDEYRVDRRRLCADFADFRRTMTERGFLCGQVYEDTRFSLGGAA